MSKSAPPEDNQPVPVRGEDLQLVMAADRTLLSMERTYAAWVRTGLAALASGVAARAFIKSAVSPAIADLMASLLIIFSGFCFIAGVWRELARFAPSAPPDLRRIPSAMLIAANTMMTSISVLALTGLWIADA